MNQTKTPLTAPTRLTRTLTVGVIETLQHAERLSKALDRLAVPEHADAVIDWPAAIAVIDAMGEAALRISELVKDGLFPSLLALKTLAKDAQAEVQALGAMLAADAPPTLPALPAVPSAAAAPPAPPARRPRRRSPAA
jgi:hypothetical protein